MSTTVPAGRGGPILEWFYDKPLQPLFTTLSAHAYAQVDLIRALINVIYQVYLTTDNSDIAVRESDPALTTSSTPHFRDQKIIVPTPK